MKFSRATLLLLLFFILLQSAALYAVGYSHGRMQHEETESLRIESLLSDMKVALSDDDRDESDALLHLRMDAEVLLREEERAAEEFDDPHEETEARLLRDLQTALNREDLASVTRLGDQCREMDLVQIDSLRMKRAAALRQALLLFCLGTLASFAALRLSALAAIASPSLRHARSRFDPAQIAEEYAVKRTEPNAFETRAIQAMTALLPPGARVLDLPCGTGRFFSLLQSLGVDVTAADASASMVAAARERVGPAQAHRVLQADLTGTPFDDNAFDCVFVIRLLHHISTPEERARIFREAARISSNRLVISFFDPYNMSNAWYLLTRILYGRPIRRRTQSIKQLRQELAQAGFDVDLTLYRRRWLGKFAFLTARKRQAPTP